MTRFPYDLVRDSGLIIKADEIPQVELDRVKNTALEVVALMPRRVVEYPGTEVEPSTL